MLATLFDIGSASSFIITIGETSTLIFEDFKILIFVIIGLFLGIWLAWRVLQLIKLLLEK